jgi:hypothetical protein
LLFFSIFLFFFFLFFACFYGGCFFVSSLKVWTPPTTTPNKQHQQQQYCYIAAATMQYPTTSATRNSWLPVVQPHCDSGRPYQDRVARQRNLGRPLPLARRKIPLPQPTNTPSPSLSLSLSLSLFCSSLCLVCSVCGGFFFLMIFNPMFETACLWNLLPKRTITRSLITLQKF